MPDPVRPPSATRFVLLVVALWTAARIVSIGAVGAQAPQPSPLDADLRRSFEAAYSLDYDDALTLARQAATRFPTESRAHRAVGSILWLDALFQRGAVTVDHYMGGVTKAQLALPRPPAALESEFKRELTLAIDLAQAAHRRNARDVQAQEDLSAAYGLQASYTASVEGSLVSAFSAGRKAFDHADDLLKRAPDNATAQTLAGSYRYLVSSLSLPTRLFAYLAGMGGGRELGLGLMEKGARLGTTIHVDAMTGLALVYSREGRHLDAIRVLSTLAREYPRNRLFALEHGAALIRAGRASEAEDVLTTGLAAFERDTRRKVPGERALWLYKRGLARLNQNHQAEATSDFTAALQSNPADWVRGRVLLAVGKVADLNGRRGEAVGHYRQARDIGRATNDPIGAAEATRLLDQPFRMSRLMDPGRRNSV